MSADLWTFASEEAQRDTDERSLSLARVASAGYWPIIAKARDDDELDHAINLASEGITAMVASICTEPGEVAVLASRVMDSYRDDWKTVEAALVAEGAFTRQHFNAIAQELSKYQHANGGGGIIPGLAEHFARHLSRGNSLFHPEMFTNAVNQGTAQSIGFDMSNMTRHHFEAIADAIASAPPKHRAALAHHFANAISQSNPRFKSDVFMRRANPTDVGHGRGQTNMENQGTGKDYERWHVSSRTAGAPARGVDNSEAQAVVDWENAPYDDRIAWEGQDDASAHAPHDVGRTALITNTEAPAYGQEMGFGFPAIQDDDEAEQVASEIAAWEHADHQQRVDMGNGIGIADESSGPNRTDQGGFRTDPVGSETSGEEPVLHASALDQSLGLQPGQYRIDAFGALIHVAVLPHAGDYTNADLHLHMQQHHPEINSRYASDSDRSGLGNLHDMAHSMGGADHEHRAESVGVFASLHPPFYLREADGQYQVVDRLGGVLASRGDRDQARAEQTRLYTMRTAMKKGAPFAGYKDFADCVSQNSDKENPQAYCGSIKHKVEDKKTSSVHLAAVAKAKSLVDEMPAAAQPHAVAKAMLVRARQFGLNEEETDLVVNAAIERCIERQVSKRALKLKDLNDRPYEATCSNRDCGNHGTAFVRDDFFGHDDDDAECPECGSPLTMGHQGSRLGFTRESDASSYAGDPHEITVRYSTRCQGKNCDADINRGDRAFYYPKGKKVLCLGKNGCGEAAQKDFNSARQDEDFYNRTYSRTASDIHPTPDEQDAEIAEMEAALQQLRERRQQQRSFPESRSASVLSRLWNRVTGRTAAGDPTNPFDPASTANTFSPAQDANAMSGNGNTSPSQAMDPSTEPPEEIDNATTTAASSKPRTKPGTNPNAPKQPQPSPMMMPAAMPLTSQPMMAAKVAIAQKILDDNPTMSDDQALHIATVTIERYPHLVVEAYGGADYVEGEPMSGCYQCGNQAMGTTHCHFCGAPAPGGGEGWDPIGGTTTIAPGQRDLRNPALASKAPEGISQENWDRADRDAGLGVGHIWTNTRCPAYHSLDPSDCTCGKGGR